MDPAASFRAVDRDGSGYISSQEVMTALSSMGWTFSVSFCAHLIRLFDSNQRGVLYFQDWTNLCNWLQSVTTSFQSADVDRSGTLNYSELYGILVQLDLHLDQPPFTALCQTFDVLKKGCLGMPEFIGVCAFVRACSSVFKTFSPMPPGPHGRISLDLNQFIFAASYTR